jgi:epoxyqueuosine reductase QueG
VVVCALRFPGRSRGEAHRPRARWARWPATPCTTTTTTGSFPLLEELARRIDSGGGVEGSLAYVDTGALSERAFAAEAGLGWVGKNAMLIHPEEGSWFWLGEVVTRASLAYRRAHGRPLRQSAAAAFDACPTGAILEERPRAVDSRKCLSYWNIEHRGPIPEEFHKPMGEWLLGCDICQEVCPWNAHSLAAEAGPRWERLQRSIFRWKRSLGLEREEFRDRDSPGVRFPERSSKGSSGTRRS